MEEEEVKNREAPRLKNISKHADNSRRAAGVEDGRRRMAKGDWQEYSLPFGFSLANGFQG